jgi:hypothetical protein
MFSRVVSNFRKKTRKVAQKGALSDSLSSPTTTITSRRAKINYCDYDTVNSSSPPTSENLSENDCNISLQTKLLVKNIDNESGSNIS